jgi:hypothetical protein
MAAHDELETGSGFSKFLVLFISNMSNRCNPRNVSSRLDLVDGVLNCLSLVSATFNGEIVTQITSTTSEKMVPSSGFAMLGTSSVVTPIKAKPLSWKM